MPRREKELVIDADGRDKGKVFILKEMSARAGEEWGYRALLALSKSGVDVPPGLFDAGIEGIAVLGLHALAGLEWHAAKPLMDEMMECVDHVPSAPNTRRKLMDRGLDGDDIEEIATRVKIKEALLELHTGFSVGGFVSGFRQFLNARANQAADRAVSGSDTPTSDFSSEE